MFFVVNKTKKNIHFGDIGLSLGPRQAIDMDKLVRREILDSSASLKKAKSNGEIEIRVQDIVDNNRSISGNSSSLSYSGLNPDDLKKIKEEIVSEMKEALRVVNNVGVSKQDLMDIVNSIRDNGLPKEGSSISGESSEDKVDIDGDVLSSISARAVNNIVKKVNIGSVKYSEKEQHDNSVLNNVNELEDLIG